MVGWLLWALCVCVWVCMSESVTRNHCNEWQWHVNCTRVESFAKLHPRVVKLPNKRRKKWKKKNNEILVLWDSWISPKIFIHIMYRGKHFHIPFSVFLSNSSICAIQLGWEFRFVWLVFQMIHASKPCCMFSQTETFKQGKKRPMTNCHHEDNARKHPVTILNMRPRRVSEPSSKARLTGPLEQRKLKYPETTSTKQTRTRRHLMRGGGG